MKIKPLLLCLACLSCSLAYSAEADTETKTVQARTLKLNIPSDWKAQETTSSMRVVQYSIPGDPEPADFVVFYFGGPTGGIQANVQRWIGQFQQDGLELNLYQGKCNAGRYILVDTQGTWNKPDGPPFARKSIPTPNSRVLNVILIEQQDGKEDYYFMKLSGHEDVVSKQTKTLREAIGADTETEKKVDLKDLK